MPSALGYREEAEPTERLSPRPLAWKWAKARLAFGVAQLWVPSVVLVGAMASLALHAAELAYGETRDAEVTSVETIHSSGGKHTLEIGFRHDLRGAATTGVRRVSLGTTDEVPPEATVAVGDTTSVSCFTLGSYHHDDLVLPRESAFHRRATSFVSHAFVVSLTIGWLVVAWLGLFRPHLRTRALYREGVLVSGTVVRLIGVDVGGRTARRQRVRYLFTGPDGHAREGSCEATDRAAFARLREGDTVQVLYDPSDWTESVVYEVGPHVFAAPPPRELVASARTTR